MIKSYKDLDVFQLAKKVDNEIFALSLTFPKIEQFSLGDQIRRSVHSILSNIAEGYGRRIYVQEFKRFLIFAQASCDETRVHLEASLDRRYINETVYKQLDENLDHIGRMISKLATNWQTTN